MMVPENFTAPTQVVLSYDGGESSTFAIKQFVYLFPELVADETILLSVTDDAAEGLPDYSMVSELLANHGNRVIKAKWTSQHEVAFLTGLKIVGTDRVGLINDVSKIISEELKVNMSSLSFNSEHGIFNGEIMLYVNDTRHLDLLIGKLEKVEGVVKVARFDSATINRNNV